VRGLKNITKGCVQSVVDPAHMNIQNRVLCSLRMVFHVPSCYRFHHFDNFCSSSTKTLQSQITNTEIDNWIFQLLFFLNTRKCIFACYEFTHSDTKTLEDQSHVVVVVVVDDDDDNDVDVVSRR
jgi:hypothetical protein